jgi:very-short-patch-repair endonuclease
MLKKHNLHLPDKSQVLIEQCSTRVDFMYAKDYLVIYIDGPVHDEPKTRADDRVKREALENMGYTVISFRYDEKKNWLNQCLQIKSVFGGSKTVGIMKE